MSVAASLRDRTAASRRGRQRYGLLLGSIVAAFAVQGTASPGPWEQVVVSVLLAMTLLLAAWAAEARPRLIGLLLVAGIAVVVLSLVEAVNGTVDGVATRIANLLLVTLAPPVIVVGVIRSLRAGTRVTIEAVFGALCIYILVGMFFAFLYGVVNRFGGPFFTDGVQATVARCLYYSFTTLTTVGYGDLTAKANLGHTLSVSEALLGQIYLVTVVSVIVSNLGRGRERTG